MINLSHPTGKHGLRSGWGGEIGGLDSDSLVESESSILSASVYQKYPFQSTKEFTSELHLPRINNKGLEVWYQP